MTESREQIENLRRILDVTRQMAATTDLDVLLGTIVAAACRVLNCERATIFLYDKTRHELYSRVATGVEAIRFPADRGIAGTAAQQRVVVNVPDAYADSRFNPEIDRRTGFVTRNLLTLPLENLDGALIGVLQALNKAGRPFDAEDEELARVLGAQAGVALHRHALLEEFAEKQRMQRDLQIARTIQQAQFPRRNPEAPGYEIAGWNRPADETGGDCFDFIPLLDGRLAIFLADATGHGIGAALVIAQCRSLVRALLTVTDDIPVIATRVNQILSQDLSDDRFVTAFLGILDPLRHRLQYVSGGQGPLLFLTGSKLERRCAADLPFAVDGDVNYSGLETFQFEPGALAALLTDGFYESQNPAGDLYGEERIVRFLQAAGRTPLTAAIDALHGDIQQFRAGRAQGDDLTAVLIRRAAP